MQSARSLLFILAILSAYSAIFACAGNASVTHITNLDTNSNIALASASESVHRLLRNSNPATSTEDAVAEERGSLFSSLKGLLKKLPGTSKRLQKSSSSLKATAAKENAVIKEAEATLKKPAYDAVKAAQKEHPGAIARVESVVKQNPSLVAAVEKSAAAKRIATAIAKDPVSKSSGWGEFIAIMVLFIVTIGIGISSLVAAKT